MNPKEKLVLVCCSQASREENEKGEQQNEARVRRIGLTLGPKEENIPEEITQFSNTPDLEKERENALRAGGSLSKRRSRFGQGRQVECQIPNTERRRALKSIYVGAEIRAGHKGQRREGKTFLVQDPRFRSLHLRRRSTRTLEQP